MLKNRPEVDIIPGGAGDPFNTEYVRGERIFKIENRCNLISNGIQYRCDKLNNVGLAISETRVIRPDRRIDAKSNRSPLSR